MSDHSLMLRVHIPGAEPYRIGDEAWDERTYVRVLGKLGW